MTEDSNTDIAAIEDMLKKDITFIYNIPPELIKQLSTNTQLKVLLLDFNMFSNYVSREVIVKYVNGNPLLFEMLPEEVLEQMIKDNPKSITKMPLDFQEKHKNSDNYYSNYFNMNILIHNPEEYIRRISARRITGVNKESVKKLKDNELKWRMGQYNPEWIGHDIYDVRDLKEDVVNLLYERAKELGKNKKLCRFLKHIDWRLAFFNYSKLIETINRISKILVSADIPNKISPKVILNYARKPTHEKLVKIVRKIYGEKAAQILEDRPEVTIELIPNFDVFRPEIIKEFGIGTLHALLTYDMPNAAAILGELARTPELMEKYKTFNQGTVGMFEDTAIGLDEKLEMFMDSLQLMNKIDFSQLTEAQKETLQIIMLDKKSKKNPEVIDFPKTEEELETYLERRKAFYNEAIKKEQDPEQIKHLISRMHFGMDFDLKEYTNLNNCSVCDMIKFYRGEGFINDVIKTGSKDFSEDELDAMELLSIFSRIKDPKILQELADRMSKSEGIINPLTYKTLRKKIPLHYHKELQKKIMTPEKALEMIENKEEGIRSEEKEGVTIIYLEGHDFTCLIHDPYVNLSHDFSQKAENLSQIWKETEDGVSTISASIINEQNPDVSLVHSGKYGLGFSIENPNQIVGMGPGDIYTSSRKRSLQPTFNKQHVGYYYPEDLIGETQKEDYEYNEIVLRRNKLQLSKIKPGTYGGKLSPDYIFVHGTNYEKALQQAKNMGIKYVFVYDEQAYKTRPTSRLPEQQKTPTPREKSDFMKEIEKTIKGEQEDAR